MSHSAILFYANTTEEDFPLILIMGREPNLGGGHSIGPTTGPYDFDAFPYCQFWNQAYGALAGLHHTRGWQLKTACRRRHASPILFGNASCRCIDSRHVGKEKIRAAVEMDEIRKHLDFIFNHSLMARVAAVILSGWNQPALQRNLEYACARLGRKQIPLIPNCPFLAARNRATVDQALRTSPHRARLQKTIGAFLGDTE